jgi:hypothetical protein
MLITEIKQSLILSAIDSDCQVNFKVIKRGIPVKPQVGKGSRHPPQ